MTSSIDDIIDGYQGRLAAIPTWTKAKRQLVKELHDALSKAGFLGFEANPADCFDLTALGNDTIQTIPAKKRGHLGCWRGKTARIVCVRPGRYRRSYLAGPTSRRPSQ